MLRAMEATTRIYTTPLSAQGISVTLKSWEATESICCSAVFLNALPLLLPCIALLRVDTLRRHTKSQCHEPNKRQLLRSLSMLLTAITVVAARKAKSGKLQRKCLHIRVCVRSPLSTLKASAQHFCEDRLTTRLTIRLAGQCSSPDYVVTKAAALRVALWRPTRRSVEALTEAKVFFSYRTTEKQDNFHRSRVLRYLSRRRRRARADSKRACSLRRQLFELDLATLLC